MFIYYQRQVIFDEQQTYELMHCLEELNTQKRVDTQKNTIQAPNSEAVSSVH